MTAKNSHAINRTQIGKLEIGAQKRFDTLEIKKFFADTISVRSTKAVRVHSIMSEPKECGRKRRGKHVEFLSKKPFDRNVRFHQRARSPFSGPPHGRGFIEINCRSPSVD